MKAVCDCCGHSVMPDIGTKLKANFSVYNITAGKVYEVAGYGRMLGCVVITNDLGDEAEYTLKFFSRI